MPLAATLLALMTIALWRFLAFLGARVTHVPPFLVVGIALCVSGLVSAGDWLSMVLLGAGPLGAAFFTWDAALKRGNPRIIGSLAYLTPLTSTLVLVALGGRSLTWVTTMAMVLIVGGARIGSLDLFRSREG